MTDPQISELALKAYSAAQDHRDKLATVHWAEQQALQGKLIRLVGSSLTQEAAAMLFGASNDPRAQALHWRVLEEENSDWDLVDTGDRVAAKQVGTGKPSNSYLVGADLGEGVTLIAGLTVPEFSVRSWFQVQVDDGPVLPVKDLAEVGGAIAAARDASASAQA
ncbi:hypothetical protein [Curtobacterium sp. VKM Ac-1395]|uniref:hypothetical protein n=1 Tax=Curtobacterium sp. VKM Ac-1395 TaxID=2783815 RepID=UPI00188A6672|nr:hypothetical protein [Curtobacterium sp. VKM Ac-1395]MBF4592057.1 hypothetical protein [Curtobacterium sp. VKM Ac-1395]